MSVTLDHMRSLAVKARAWVPAGCQGDCEGDPAVAIRIVDCNACTRCLGASLASEDVTSHVDLAMTRSNNSIIAHDPRHRSENRNLAAGHAIAAERIADYLGGSPDVTAFANAVREFCLG